MGWVRRGRLFAPQGGTEWMVSHAALPVVQARGERQRVYFSTRDAQGRARIAWFDFDPADPERILATAPAPVLDLGTLGAFDDRGVSSSCIVSRDGRLLLFYTGWSLGVTVPFYLSIGLALSEDDGRSFQRRSAAPVLGRSPTDPYLTASPWVLADGRSWRMWYVSCSAWRPHPDGPRHHYRICHAESADGFDWKPSGQVCIDYADESEYAFGRPCVIRDPDCYRMWYCYRGDRYRLGYAESADGLHWERKDSELSLAGAPGEWEAGMNAYPCVFDHAGQRYMLYNGNDYGRTGIGLARFEGQAPAR